MTFWPHFLARQGWESSRMTKRCIHCRADFASKKTSETKTCSKSCAAYWRESKGKNRRTYQARLAEYRRQGLQ